MGTSIWDQSTTAGSNTDIGGVNAGEGMAPSNLNNVERATEAQVLGALLGVTAAGTDTYTATLAPAPDALRDGMPVNIRFTNANTSATPTLAIGALGAKTITKNSAAALVAGDIPAGHEAILRYVSSSTTWRLMNPANLLADAANGGLVITANTIAVKPSDLTAKATRALADSVVVDDVAGAANGKKQLVTALLSGMPIQIVNTETGAVSTGTTVVPFDDTIPQNTEGDQFMSLAITPTSASSTLLIDVVFAFNNTANASQTTALFQDATANALAAIATTNSNAVSSHVFRHKMTAGTTSATTFKVRSGPSAAGTTTFNGSTSARLLGGIMASSITITEILP